MVHGHLYDDSLGFNAVRPETGAINDLPSMMVKYI